MKLVNLHSAFQQSALVLFVATTLSACGGGSSSSSGSSNSDSSISGYYAVTKSDTDGDSVYDFIPKIEHETDDGRVYYAYDGSNSSDADGVFDYISTESYNAAGYLLTDNSISTFTGSGSLRSYTRNAAGEYTQFTLIDPDGSLVETIDQTFDADGNLIEVRVDEEGGEEGADGIVDMTFTYTYDDGVLTRMDTEYPDDGALSGEGPRYELYTYDANGYKTKTESYRLLSGDTDYTLYTTRTETYDANGNRTYLKIENHNAGEINAETTYTYDEQNRLTSETYMDGRGITIAYEENEDGSVTAKRSFSYNTTVFYETYKEIEIDGETENVFLEEWREDSGSPGVKTNQYLFTFDENNLNTAYAYDSNGNGTVDATDGDFRRVYTHNSDGLITKTEIYNSGSTTDSTGVSPSEVQDTFYYKTVPTCAQIYGDTVVNDLSDNCLPTVEEAYQIYLASASLSS